MAAGTKATPAKAEVATNGSSGETQAPERTEHESLAAALLAAQVEMPAVDKDGENPHFNSKFVTLGNLLNKSRPVLNRHGIVVVQMPTRAEDGSPVLRTRLVHESGEMLEFDSSLVLTGQGSQAVGSAITYMRRYTLASVLAISDSEDDDGQAAASSQGDAPAARKLTEDEAGRLLVAVQAAGLEDQLPTKLRSFGVKKLTELDKEQGIKVYEWAGGKVTAPDPADDEEGGEADG